MSSYNYLLRTLNGVGRAILTTMHQLRLLLICITSHNDFRIRVPHDTVMQE